MRCIVRLVTVAAPGVAMLVLWEWFTRDSERLRFLFASPSSVAHVAVADAMSLAMWRDFGATAATATTGLVAGWLAGSVLGLTLWTAPILSAIARPYILAASAVPIFALAPMLIIWFGIGFTPRVLMAAFPVFLASTVAAFWLAGAADERHSEWVRGIGLSRAHQLRFVIVPETLAGLVVTAKNNVGAALIGTFIGEFVVSQAGLGKYVLRAGSLYDTPRVLWGLCLFVALAGVMLLLASLLTSVPATRAFVASRVRET